MKYSNFVQRLKWIILVLFAALFAIAIWRATELEEQNEQEEWFKDGHYMKETLDLMDTFASSEEVDLVYLVVLFGAKGVNRDGTDRWDALDYGKIKWDSDFDLSSYDAQLYFYQVCENLTTFELTFQSTSVSCPMIEFKLYLESMGETFPYLYTNDVNLTLNETYVYIFIFFVLFCIVSVCFWNWFLFFVFS